MRLALIVAVASNNVIGNHNQLPWHMPADLQHFKRLTLGKPIIMGRKTYDSIGKPLPGRRNIIVTRQADLVLAGCEVVHSLAEALALTEEDPASPNKNEVMLIGGAELFKEALPLATTLYLTWIHHEFVGDAYFPSFDQSQWQEIVREEHPADENNPYSYSFVTYKR